MKVLFAISSLSAGGAERQAGLLCGLLAGVGHKVLMVTFDDVPDHYTLAAGIERMALRDGTPATTGVKLHALDHRLLKALIESRQPDVIISFGSALNVKVLAAAPKNIPVLVSERTDPAKMKETMPWRLVPFVAAARRVLYPTANTLVVQTKAAAAWCARHGLNRHIAVIPNLLSDRLPASAPARQKRVLAIGRMTPEKGHDVLIRAFAGVASRHPDWSLRIVGDGPCKPMLEALATRLGLRGLEIRPTTTDVRSEYNNAAMFVLPSRIEGFPNVLLEAMQSGCPVIASDCPLAPREIVSDGADGLLFCNEDTRDLEQKIEMLIADGDKRKSLGAQGSLTARRYLPENVFPLWSALLSAAAAKAH